MALSEQKFREIVFQLLYSQEMGHADAPAMNELMMAELTVSKRNVRLAQERVQQIEQLLPQIDTLIRSVAISYSFDRIQVVTRNILRLGIFELFFDARIPPKVAIAEAIRLSRKFNTAESASFVNALLDHLYKLSLGEKLDAQQLENQAQALLQTEQVSSDKTEKYLSEQKEDAQPAPDDENDLPSSY